MGEPDQVGFWWKGKEMSVTISLLTVIKLRAGAWYDRSIY